MDSPGSGISYRMFVAFVVVGGSIHLPCMPAGAETGTVTAHISGMGGAQSTLSLTYTPPLDAESATADVRAIADASGWTITAPVGEDESGATYTAHIAPAITPDDAGTSVLYPLVVALGRYPTIGIALVGASTGPPGEFEGENRYIHARWTRSSNVTQYAVRVKDDSVPGPEALALPDTPAQQTPSGASAPLPDDGAGRGSTRGLWLLLVAASLATGLFVWGLTSWLLSLWVARRRARGAGGRTGPGPEQPGPSE